MKLYSQKEVADWRRAECSLKAIFCSQVMVCREIIRRQWCVHKHWAVLFCFLYRMKLTYIAWPLIYILLSGRKTKPVVVFQAEFIVDALLLCKLRIVNWKTDFYTTEMCSDLELLICAWLCLSCWCSWFLSKHLWRDALLTSDMISEQSANTLRSREGNFPFCGREMSWQIM